MIVSQPTWGVDVGAAAQIRGELLALRDKGCAVLVVSEELDELFEICDRLVVIVAGYPGPMMRFIGSNPGLASRFTRTVSFPAYSPPDLIEILRRMASGQSYHLPEDAAQVLRPWIQSRQNADDWGNAREMRTVLEKARGAQALRLAHTPGGSVQDLTLDDLRAAIGET